jgi:hypothetical protein
MRHLRLVFCIFLIFGILSPVLFGDEDDRSGDVITHAPDRMKTGSKAISIRHRIEEKYTYPQIVFWEKLGALPSHRSLIREYFFAASTPESVMELECLDPEEESQEAEKINSGIRNALERGHLSFLHPELIELLRKPNGTEKTKAGEEYSGFASVSSRYHFREYMYRRMINWMLCKSLEESQKVAETRRIPEDGSASHKERLLQYNAQFQKERDMSLSMDKDKISRLRRKGYILKGSRTKDLLQEWRLGKIRLPEKEELKIVEKETVAEEKKETVEKKETDAKNVKKKSGI